jgi:hypothetical protein
VSRKKKVSRFHGLLLHVFAARVGIRNAAWALEFLVIYSYARNVKKFDGFEDFAVRGGWYSRRTAYRRRDILLEAFPEMTPEDLADWVWSKAEELIEARDVMGAGQLAPPLAA